MKFFHLSDLHLGKRLFGYSLLQDQSYILQQILDFATKEHPDAIVIAGDIYDRPVPPEDAVTLFDQFLVSLSDLNITVLLISGNHDSPERLAFGGRLMNARGIYVSPSYHGTINRITLSDHWGEIDFFLMPFIKPAHVRRFFPQKSIDNYNDAVNCALSNTSYIANKRRVLVAHQFVTGASISDSEELCIGGLEQVSATVLCNFDYVALGHLHKPQTVSFPHLRYCGSPLPYSFSEAQQTKSISVINLDANGLENIQLLPLYPLHPLSTYHNTFSTLMTQKPTNDYVRIILTDTQEIPDAIGQLRTIYPNLMRLDYDQPDISYQQPFSINTEHKIQSDPVEVFNTFYEIQNGYPMSSEQRDFITHLILDIDSCL